VEEHEVSGRGIQVSRWVFFGIGGTPWLIVEAPWWFLARAVALRETGLQPDQMYDYETLVHAADITVSWAGSAAGTPNDLRVVETRNPDYKRRIVGDTGGTT
jgi:hypothetical protein